MSYLKINCWAKYIINSNGQQPLAITKNQNKNLNYKIN